MKYLLALITLVLGIAIGYYVANKSGKKEERRFVLRPSAGNTVALKNGVSLKNSFVLRVKDAEDYLTNFKNQYPHSSISFSIDSIDAATLLSNRNSSGGLRAYFGLKNPQQPDSVTLMFVGIDANRENVFIDVLGEPCVIDYTNPCPKDCPLIPNSTDHDRRTIQINP